MDRERMERFLEFLFIGVLLGLVEDLLAIKLSTDAEITFQTLIIVLAVAIPFAAFSELIVDKDEFVLAEKLWNFIEKEV